MTGSPEAICRRIRTSHQPDTENVTCIEWNSNRSNLHTACSAQNPPRKLAAQDHTLPPNQPGP